MKKTAERVFQLIEALNMTDYRFSQEYGFPKSTLSNWRNKDITPSTEKLEEFCKCIGISMDDFYSDKVICNDDMSETEYDLMSLKVLALELERYDLLQGAVDYCVYLLSKEKKNSL